MRGMPLQPAQPRSDRDSRSPCSALCCCPSGGGPACLPPLHPWGREVTQLTHSDSPAAGLRLWPGLRCTNTTSQQAWSSLCWLFPEFITLAGRKREG